MLGARLDNHDRAIPAAPIECLIPMVSGGNRRITSAAGSLLRSAAITSSSWDLDLTRRATSRMARTARPPDSLGGHVDPWGPYAPGESVVAEYGGRVVDRAWSSHAVRSRGDSVYHGSGGP
jgi:hypothetical protein